MSNPETRLAFYGNRFGTSLHEKSRSDSRRALRNSRFWIVRDVWSPLWSIDRVDNVSVRVAPAEVECEGHMEFGSVRAIARTAYIFTYPLVMSYGDLYARVVDTAAPCYNGGFEAWCHPSVIPSDRNDGSGEVLQAAAWVDVRKAPRTVNLRRGAVSLRVADLWGFNVAEWASGERRPAQAVLLAAPAWMGEVARDVGQVARGESPFLRVVVSAQRSGAGKGLTAEELTGAVVFASPAHDDGCSLEPPPEVKWMAWTDADAVTDHYWSCANFALSLVEPHTDDRQMLDRIGEIGVVPGEPWDAGWFSFGMLEAISEGMDQALSDLLAAAAGPVDLGGLGRSRADFDRDYFGRALLALADPSLLSVRAAGRP